MMLVTKKSDPKNSQTKLTSNYIVKMIQEDCYDEKLSLIPEKCEDGKMRFLEGTLSLLMLHFLQFSQLKTMNSGSRMKPQDIF